MTIARSIILIGWAVGHFSLLPMAKAAQVPGSLPGNASVQSSGAASYSIPLQAVPGTGGVEPRLTLDYNHHTPNGILGIGWSLGGLSTIYRVGTNDFFESPGSDYIHDAELFNTDPVDFDGNDRLALDGQRLALTSSGAYGAGNSEYRMEKDRFAHIKAGSTVVGTGTRFPASFTVRTKDGLIMTYGGTADSRIEAQGKTDVVVWALSKVEDSVGNEMTFTYTETNGEGEFHINKIAYSFDGTDYDANSVVFTYLAKSADEIYPLYQAGAKSRSSKRLSNIRMKEGTTVVRQYDFTYATDSSTKFSSLTGVKLTSDGDNLPQTVFSYQDYNPSSPFGKLGNWPTNSSYLGDGFSVSDANGDGRFELHTNRTSVYQYDPSTSTMGFTSYYPTFSGEGPGGIDQIKTKTGDFNGDGVTDFLVGYYENYYEEDAETGEPCDPLDRCMYYTGYADYKWRVFISTESGGQTTMVFNSEIAIESNRMIRQVTEGNRPFEILMDDLTDYRVADVNGDGRSDLVKYNKSTQRYTLQITSFNTVNGVEKVEFVEYANVAFANLPTTSHESYALIDFNGDGMADFFIDYKKSGSKREFKVFLSTGNAFSQTAAATHTFDFNLYLDDLLYHADINGDGLADVLFRDIGSNGITTVTPMLSTGTGWVEAGSINYNGGGAQDQFPLAADVNGDGRSDFVVFHKKFNRIHLKVYFSRGDHLASSPTIQTTTYDWDENNIFIPIDLNGDGLTEFLYMEKTGATISKSYKINPFQANGNKPGLLTGVVDGFGAKTQFEYGPISDPTLYLRDRSKAYPMASIQGAHYVVSKLSKDDGLGAAANTNYSLSHTYSSGDSHQLGRGFLGFNQFASVDDQTGVKVERALESLFPYTGMVKESSTYIPDDDTTGKYNLLTREVNTLAKHTISHSGSQNTTYFPYISESRVYSYETNDDYYAGNAPNYPLGDGESGPNAYAYSVTTNEFDDFDTSTNYNDYGNNTLIAVKYYENTGAATSATYKLTHSSDTYNIYYNNTAATKWHLGRLLFSKSVAKVYDKASGSTLDTQIRQSAFAYNSTTGLLEEEVLQPQSPNNYDVGSAMANADATHKPETGSYDYAARWEIKTHHDYDGYGNIITTTVSSPATGDHSITSRVTRYAYDSTKRYITRETNPLGQEVDTVHMTSSQHKDTSLVRKVIDINDLEMVYAYDKFGRVTGETRPDGTQTVTTRYGSGSLPAGAPTGAVFAVSSYARKASTRYTYDTTAFYDRVGREIRAKTVNGDGESVYRDTTYGSDMRVSQATAPYFATGGTKYYTYAEYHPDGRPKKTRKEVERRNGAGKKEIHSSIAYRGLETRSVTDSSSSAPQTTKTIRNAKGEVVEVIDNNSQSIKYRYDGRGNLTRTTDPGNNQIVLSYDLHDNRTAMNDPDAGNWTYQYNALGELVKQTDAESNVTVLQYDKLGRLTRRTIDPGLGGADQVWTWTYDTAAGKGKGLIAREAGLSGFQKVYTYDSFSRLSRVAVTIAGSTYTSSTDYDTYGRVAKIHYPDSFYVQNHYSTSNYDLYQVTDSDSHTWWEAEDYDYAGRIIDYDLAGGNMTTTATLLAGSNFLKEARSQRGTVDLLRMEYDFDNHGNLTWRKDTMRNHEEEFTYDNLNRLDQQRQKTSGGSWGSRTNLADYDNLGNITAKAGVTGSYTYGSTRPHAVTSVGGVSYTYNNNGNVKLRGDHPIWWTAFNKPLSIFSDDASYSFYYDNDFNRIIETIYGEGFSRVKINPSALYQIEIEDGVKTRRRHIPTPVGVVGVSNYDESDSSTARRYFLKDHLGSSSVIADDSGNAQSNYSYDAWGNPRNASDWSALSAWPDYEADEGFTGHEMMSSLELVHMNGRVYDPLIGRFLSPDIVIQAEGNLQNYNRYSYVLNNPLKYTDPSGNEIFSIIATVIAIGAKDLAAHHLFLLFFTAGFLDAYAESGDVGVSLKAGLISGTSAYFAHEIGTWFKDGWAADAFQGPTLANVVKATFHGVRGGIAAELSGGNFGAGAGAAFFGDYGGGLASEYIGEGLIVSAILGGTASEIGGGKFSNGALSGAMTFVLNTAMHREVVDVEIAESSKLTREDIIGDPSFSNYEKRDLLMTELGYPSGLANDTVYGGLQDQTLELTGLLVTPPFVKSAFAWIGRTVGKLFHHTSKGGLGSNPFKGKTSDQIDDMFKKKGFELRGPNPKGGTGGYVNPKSGRSYHIDPKDWGKHRELNHVDVNRLRDYKGPLKKKKFPYKGD